MLYLLLFGVAVLIFLSSWILLKALQERRNQHLQMERVKSRIGLGQELHIEHVSSERCWWCSLGRALGPRSTREIEKTQRMLVSAGFRNERYIGAYFFIKFALVLVSLLIALFIWALFAVSPVIFFVPLILLLLPEWLLKGLANKRLSRISESLPDFLDMTNVSMNSGLSYLGSIKRVSEELKELQPEICYEFEFLLDQIKIGVPRQDALRQFAIRNPTREIEGLVQVLIQNEKMGSSISDALNEFSRRMYQNRESQMEEKAAKTSAKMAMVIMPFLLAPYLILLLGERMVALGRGL
ncbi:MULTISPECIES: type II secretion system F family protein [Thiomicrorhabdus]|uniref:Type II secretion system F family protein n=1 Tax=Thiomicrorhabdus heinhorstiae TaxID=2748010 RepID=A0ABS0BY09_9GAMM|nr:MULTISPECIES: type II secretion system F family protein [Thiomicrorhabdus]MBF6058654.1 type II secretion system F family protein [Thiomicrorhabdus heinhorstiae]